METPVAKTRWRGLQQQQQHATDVEELSTETADAGADASAMVQHKRQQQRRRRRRRRVSGSSESEIDLMLEELGIPDSGKKKHKQQVPAKGSADVIELITPPRATSVALPRRVDGTATVDQALASLDTTVVDLTSPELSTVSAEAVAIVSTRLSSYEASCSVHQRARRTIISVASSLPSAPSSPVRLLDISVLSTPPDSPQQQSSDQECDAMAADLMRPLSERLHAARRGGGGGGDAGPTSNAPGPCVPIAQGGGFAYSSITATSATAYASRVLHAIPETLQRREADDAITAAMPTTTATTAPTTIASLNPVTAEKNAKAPRKTQKPANDAHGRSVVAAMTTTTVSSSKAKRTEAPVAACVRMERSLNDSDAGDTLRKALATHVYNSKPLMFEMEPPFDCVFANVIQWMRREDGVPTSSKALLSPRLRFFSSAIYFQAHDFLQLLEEKSYAEVRIMMQFLKSEMQKRQQQSRRQRPSVEDNSNVDQLSTFLIIEGMDRCLIDRKKQNNPGSVHFSFSDLHEMAFQLFMDTETHTKFTVDLESTASYVAMVTRELVLAATKQSNAQEEFLESVPRLHSFRVTGSGATMNNFANAWLRMLQMIPGVSEDKAQSILDHFPTFTSLLSAYSDPTASRQAKEDLLADKLSGKHIERALSKRIFNVFCVDDPEAHI